MIEFDEPNGKSMNFSNDEASLRQSKGMEADQPRSGRPPRHPDFLDLVHTK